MCGIEQPVASICASTTCVLVIRQAQCNKTYILVSDELFSEITLKGLSLSNSSNDHDTNSGLKIANVLHKVDHRLPTVDHGIY